MKKKVLIIMADNSWRTSLAIVLKKEGYEPYLEENSKTSLEKIERGSFDFVVTEIHMKEMDGLEFIEKAKEKNPELILLILSSQADANLAVETIKTGACDYLSQPCKPEEVFLALRKAEERETLRKENGPFFKDGKKEYNFSNIVSKSRIMANIFSTIQKISEYKTTCLLLGESGTGKELLAKAIHYNSSRADKPFITVNCGAIPENLLESELFGHVKGAFTGAIRTKKGLFEEAHLGTLFLDEIGELPLMLQVKLLRALQEEEIRQVGGVSTIKVDVRIVAATVKDLTKEVETGTFREDLFYRLNVLPIHVPPLRERKEDISILVAHFLKKVNRKLSVKLQGVSSEAMKALLDYDWPGNVRELENVIERGMILVSGDTITLENLPSNFRGFAKTSRTVRSFSSEEFSIKKMERRIEEELIMKALEKVRGNKTKAAHLLEISHRALLYKIKNYKLESKIRKISAHA